MTLLGMTSSMSLTQLHLIRETINSSCCCFAQKFALDLIREMRSLSQALGSRAPSKILKEFLQEALVKLDHKIHSYYKDLKLLGFFVFMLELADNLHKYTSVFVVIITNCGRGVQKCHK